METRDLVDGVRDVVAKFVPHLSHFTKGVVLSRTRSATVVSIDDEIVVKYGGSIKRAEAETLKFLRKETKLPVPEVVQFCEDDEGVGYLILRYIHGSCLEDVWDSLDDEFKNKFVSELTEHFRELHSLTETFIGTVGRGPPRDPIFANATPVGPYDTESEMNEAIVRASRLRWAHRGGNPPESYVATVLPWLPTDHKFVFSHSQFGKCHFVVDLESKKVVGIVGWGQAGFFPEYWDFVNGLVQQWWFSDWTKYVPFMLKPFYKEYTLWYRLRQMSIGLKVP